jgi:hypothetical protein
MVVEAALANRTGVNDEGESSSPNKRVTGISSQQARLSPLQEPDWISRRVLRLCSEVIIVFLSFSAGVGRHKSGITNLELVGLLL